MGAASGNCAAWLRSQSEKNLEENYGDQFIGVSTNRVVRERGAPLSVTTSVIDTAFRSVLNWSLRLQ
jgi:hypothetical protein